MNQPGNRFVRSFVRASWWFGGLVDFDFKNFWSPFTFLFWFAEASFFVSPQTSNPTLVQEPRDYPSTHTMQWPLEPGDYLPRSFWITTGAKRFSFDDPHPIGFLVIMSIEKIDGLLVSLKINANYICAHAYVTGL